MCANGGIVCFVWLLEFTMLLYDARFKLVRGLDRPYHLLLIVPRRCFCRVLSMSLTGMSAYISLRETWLFVDYAVV